MQHDIDIQIIDNTTGIPPSSDGIMGIFAWAVAVANTFSLNTAYLLTGMADLDALGIDAAYDIANGTAIYQQVNDFYTQASNGAILWLVGVPMNTDYTTYVAADLFDTLIRFTGQADSANRVKIVGLCYAPPAALQVATDFPADVISAITAAQTKQVALFRAGYQISFIIDGYNMSADVTPSELGTQATNTAYAVSLCITGTQPNGVSAVGLALGRFARISIGHGFGAVKDGAINTPAAYLTNSVLTRPGTVLVVGDTYTVLGGPIVYNAITYAVGAQFTVLMGITSFTSVSGGYVVDNITPVGNIPGVKSSQINGLSPTSILQLGAKQFMFIRTWENKSGLYWNDASTCISSSKSFSSQEYNRVANSLSADALSFFTEEMGSNLPLDKSTGNVAKGWLNTQQETYYDQFIGPLNDTGGTGDVTDAVLTVTGTNFNATRRLAFSLKIVASLILGGVDGTVEFVAQL